MSRTPELPDADWFASVLDAMDDMVLVKGPRSRLLWANRAFRDRYALDNEQLRSLIDGQQSDPDDTLQYVRDDRRVFVERTSIDVPSEPVTDHRGEVGFFHTVKSPIFRDGEVVMQVGVSRELGSDVPLERPRDLRERDHVSTRNVRALVRSMPAPVVMLDAAHRIVMWNDAFAGVVDHLDAFDGPATNLLHADYETTLEPALPLLDELDAVVQGAAPTSRVVELVLADGSPRHFCIDCRTWTDASEAVGGTLAVLHDVTDMLATEQRLREANEELAQFNYRLSHDVVAPISTAQGYLELMAEELEGGNHAELPELLDETRRQLDRLHLLVADLSSLARAGADVSRTETIALQPLVDELRAELGGATPARLSIGTDLALAELDSDRTRIRQMLSNLIENATKYHDSAETAPHVTVRSRREGRDSVIEVSDNGIGIDPAFGERAFEMFARDNSSVPGTGLGLYIIGKHADRLGGTLSIASHAKPTVMRLTLPPSPGAER